MKNNDDFLGDIKKELNAERDADYSVTPEEGERLLARYPKDTPDEYKKIGPERFFDGD
jgi:hypothetical protein